MENRKAVIVTWGCTHNQKDSELIEFELISNNIDIVSYDNIDDADILLFNTCTVKSPTENKIIHELDKYIYSDKQIIVTGCLTQADPIYFENRYPNYLVLGVNAVKYIQSIVNQTDGVIKLPVITPKHQQSNDIILDDWIDKPSLLSNKKNPNLNIIQINEGCLNACTFCATRFARGRLKSFKRKSIIKSIENDDSKEIWLTSQDTACWGFDINDTLPSLLDEIVEISRDFWVRVGMGNPNNLIKIIDDLILQYKSDKIYKFLHIPLQSGSNKVLKHMKRGYTVEEFNYIIERIRSEIKDITISTDIICGYPTETEEDFNKTCEIIRKVKPEICNISRYWERKYTSAASLPQLSHEVRKKRTGILTKIIKEQNKNINSKWINWSGKVLINELGEKGGYQGRNIYYKPIIIHNENINLGSWVNVKIVDTKDTYLVGEVID